MKISTFLIFCSLVGFTACQSKTGITPDGLESLKGDIKGTNFLVSESGMALEDHSGVTVSVEGTVTTSTTTNTKGEWALLQVPSGTYNITYSKQGYGMFKQYSIQHVGGSVPTYPYPFNTIARTELSPVSKMSVANFSASAVNRSVTLTGTINNPVNVGGRLVAILLKRGKVATLTDHEYSFTFHAIGNNFSHSIDYELAQTQIRAGFKTGDNVYATIHTLPYGYTDFLAFIDPSTRLYQYPAANPDPVSASFILP